MSIHPNENISSHVISLGKLMCNFQSLEFMLRGFLHRLPNAPALGLPSGTDIYTKPVGTQLPVNDITSYESLGQLISRYNRETVKLACGKVIDITLVNLRDALAHGRTSMEASGDIIRLLKFDKPQHGKVRIAFNEEMNRSWFERNNKRVYDAMMEVHQAYKNLTGE